MKFIKSNISKDTNTKVVGYSNSTTTNSPSSSSGTASSIEAHTLWGQTYDGTKDVSGDLSNVGKITASDDISTEGDLIIKEVDNDGSDGDLVISVDGNSATFTGKDEYVFDNTIDAPKATLDEATVTTLGTTNITNSDTIKTKNLEVTGSAHFFELVIDKIKAAGGAAIFTPADGFEVDIVESVTNGYKLYWQCQDGDGNQRDNMWKVNDQAICQSFNRATVDTSHNVSNKYYWCLVTEVSDSSNPTLKDDKYYNYIVISTKTCDGTVNPEKGDNIAMLGYRGTDDEQRQSAIYISAYTSLDSGLKAPLLAQYRGINDFSLASHRKSYFDANGSKFVGNFEVSSGEDIETYVTNQINTNSKSPYIGSDGYWYIWNSSTQSYTKTSTKGEGTEGHSPYISNGYWYAWNSSSSSYVNTGIKAEGKDGTNGKDGDNTPWIKLTSKASSNVTPYITVFNGNTISYQAGSSHALPKCTVFKKDTLEYVNRSYGDSETLASWITTNYDSDEYLIAIFTNQDGELTGNLSNLLTNYGCPVITPTLEASANNAWCFVGYKGCTSGDALFSYSTNGQCATLTCFVKNGKLCGADSSSTYGLKTSIDGLTSTCTSIQNNMVTTSVLEQKANSILASVNDTYVKIGDGNITLNGDTKVNGSLTLNADTQGFVVVGNNGITEISPKSIGTYSSFIGKTTTNTQFIANQQVGAYGSGSNYEFIWTVSQDLGSIASGKTITFKSFSQTIKNSSGTALGAATGTITVYSGSTVKATYTISSSTYSTLGSITTDGNAITVKGSFNATYTSTECGNVPSIDTKITWLTVLPITSGYTLIGYDGIASSYGDGRCVYMGSEGFIVNYGNYQYKINTNGMYQNTRRNVYYHNGSSLTTFTVTEPYDTVICAGSKALTVKLPSSPYEGQTVRVFDKTSNNCYIHSNYKTLIIHNQTSGSAQTARELDGNGVWEYTYYNNTWYEACLAD